MGLNGLILDSIHLGISLILGSLEGFGLLLFSIFETASFFFIIGLFSAGTFAGIPTIFEPI